MTNIYKKYIIFEEDIDLDKVLINKNTSRDVNFIKSGVYFLRNKINNRIYIGSTNNFFRRKIEHKKLLQTNKHPNNFLQNDYKKLHHISSFWNIFSFTIKEIILEEKILLEREQLYIDLYFDEQFNCYNFIRKAGSVLGTRWTKESKQKHSIRRQGQNNPMWGKKHNKQTCLLVSKQQQKKVLKYSLKGELLETFDSVICAAKSVNASRQLIGHCCNRYRKTGKGFIWRYKNDTKK